jgi:transmembrane sensor
LFVPSQQSYDHLLLMTEHIPTPVRGSARKQAVHWIVRLQSGAVTGDDRRAFDAWLEAQPEHKREFEQVSKMWTTLDDARSLLSEEIDKAEVLWADHAVNRRSAFRWWWTRAASVGSVLALLLATVWWWTSQPETVFYETAKGAQRLETLTDGSTVTLNTDTKLTVQMSRGERLIRLERGEAWFTVSHDEQRPFTVQAANGTIRDIGTQFIVAKSARDVMISVWEGLVEVDAHAPDGSSSASHRVTLHGGQQLSYGIDGRLSAVVAFDQSTVGSWREGKLIFRSQPLKQVLAEVARYGTEDIRLLDPSLDAFPVSGVFNIQDIEQAMHTLQASLPIRVQRVHDHLIIVERAPASMSRR